MNAEDLAGTSWTLLQFETDASVIPAVPQARATLAFATHSEPGETGSAGAGEPANRISGTGGCNRYFGSYTLTDNHLKLSPLGATRMMCTPERMAQEDRFFQALQSADSCELRDGELLITYAGADCGSSRSSDEPVADDSACTNEECLAQAMAFSVR